MPSTSTSIRRSKDLYAVKLAIQAQSKREQEAYRLQGERKPQAAAERPTTLHLKPVRTAAERHAHRSLEVNKATIKAVADKTQQHRRTQSETHPPITNSKADEIKPRYLAAKQQNQQLNTKFNEIGVNMSSSEESSNRNPKPVLNKRLAINEVTKSNMSRDSLASPVKNAISTGPQCTISAASEVDLSIDSLGGSMHSSVKSSRSNKSVSQQSFNASVRAKNLSAVQLRKTNNVLSSNEHSPASVSTTATKSSRISSVNSTTSSSKGVALRKVPPQSTSVPLRHSFVSPKSREILAAKQNAPNRNTITNKTSTDVNATSVANNSKRPLSYPTTLHLRRSAKLSPIPSEGKASSAPVVSIKSTRSLHPPSASKQNKTDHQSSYKAKAVPDSIKSVRRIEKSVIKVDAKSIVTTKNNRIKDTKKTAAIPTTIKTPIEIEMHTLPAYDDNSPEFVSPLAATRVESKLERSSTFCKESSGLKTSVSLVSSGAID